MAKNYRRSKKYVFCQVENWKNVFKMSYVRTLYCFPIHLGNVFRMSLALEVLHFKQ